MNDPTPGCCAKCEVSGIKIAELDKRLDLHIKYQQQAVEKSAFDMRERLASMNEFREQLKDQTARYVTRDEAGIKHEGFEKRLGSLELTAANWQGRFTVVGAVSAIIGGALGILGSLLIRLTLHL